MNSYNHIVKKILLAMSVVACFAAPLQTVMAYYQHNLPYGTWYGGVPAGNMIPLTNGMMALDYQVKKRYAPSSGPVYRPIYKIGEEPLYSPGLHSPYYPYADYPIIDYPFIENLSSVHNDQFRWPGDAYPQTNYVPFTYPMAPMAASQVPF